MSLKAFHIFFIAVSILLAFGFGLWEIRAYTDSGTVGRLIAGLLSFGVAVGLIIYGIHFLKKLKHVGYL
jgi:hypothetical protein